jgi:hypothetical protein
MEKVPAVADCFPVCWHRCCCPYFYLVINRNFHQQGYEEADDNENKGSQVEIKSCRAFRRVKQHG